VQCKKSKEAQPKCYTCEEDHPANYRGCILAKKIQAVQNKATRPKNPSKQKGKPAAATRNKKLTKKTDNKQCTDVC
jgi:hypothetical protein